MSRTKELKRLRRQWRMTGAVHADIAAVFVFVMFERGTGAVVSNGNLHRRCSVNHGCHMTLHGMGTLVNAIDRNSQHDRKEDQRKNFQMD